MIEHIELTLAPYDPAADNLCVQGSVAVVDYQILDGDGRLAHYIDVCGMNDLLGGVDIARWYGNAAPEPGTYEVIAAYEVRSIITKELDYNWDVEWTAEFCGLVDIV